MNIFMFTMYYRARLETDGQINQWSWFALKQLNHLLNRWRRPVMITPHILSFSSFTTRSPHPLPSCYPTVSL